MLTFRAIKFSCFVCVIILNSCTSLAQISGIKVIEENQEKKYTQIKTAVFKNDATILKDTTNEFNRYPSENAVKQYTPSLADVQAYEDVLKNSFPVDKQVSTGNNETFVKYYKRFNRQYSGYIDKSGDTILVICFLDFSKKNEAKVFFYNWKYQNSFFGTVLYLHKKSPGIYSYALNLRTKSLSAYKL